MCRIRFHSVVGRKNLLQTIDITSMEDLSYWEFSYMSKVIRTRYTPAQILECMGRLWALERDRFHYSLCPRDRFSVPNMNEYHREWEYRIEESIRLRQELRQRDLNRPQQQSLQVSHDNDELLEMAVNMIRHENNQMQIRINRYEAVSAACNRQYGQTRTIPSDGELDNLRHLPQYCTDGDLIDED